MTKMEDIYLTTSETLYPRETNFEEIVVRLYGRNRDHDARTVTVRGFQPYFLTRSSDAAETNPSEHEEITGYEEVDIDPLGERFDSNPTELTRVNLNNDYYRNIRQEFAKTYGADCLFTERFRIDKSIRTGVRVPTDKGGASHHVVDHEDVEAVEMKDVTPRVLTLDIETDDRGAGFPEPGDARILSISVHDSYTDDYQVFLDTDGDDLQGFFDLSEDITDLSLSDIGLTEPDTLKYADSEQKMLDLFGSYVQQHNPDIICGWNSGDDSVDGFDLPHIISRMKNVGARPERLSREGRVEVDEYNDDFTPKIVGRAMYDLMDGWGDTKFTEPRSFKLDDVAEQALGDAKIEHQEQGYYEMYRDDPVKFINYNVKDTRLTVEINDEEGVLSFKKRLKDIVGVDWKRTHENNEFIEMSVRRKCSEHDIAMITAWDNDYVGGDTDEVNYEGAYVFSPFEGLRENVVGIDLESLYPRTQQMLNVSPDARIEKSKALVEGIPFVEAENGQAFRNDVDGIMRELITDYMKLKAKFKEERNKADPGTEEREKLAEIYGVTKTVVNCVTGDHQVMTADGLVNIKDVAVGDEVYSLDPETREVELKTVTETFAYPDYDGDLIEIDTTNISQTLTPNHRTLVRQNDGYVQEEDYSFVEAGDLKKSPGYEMPTPVGSKSDVHGSEMDTFSLAKTEIIGGGEVRVHPDVHGRTFNANLPGGLDVEYDDNSAAYRVDADDYLAHQQTIEEMCKDRTTEVHVGSGYKWIPVFYDGDAFVELLAWYATEGYVYRDKNCDNVTVNISQKEAGDRPAVHDVLTRCGLEYKTDENQLWFSSHILGDLLENICGSGSENKRLPDFVWDLSRGQKRLLFQTLIAGDGDVGQDRYTTMSEDLRDDFMRLAVEFGNNTHYNYEESWGGYRVRWDEANNHFKMNRSSEIREADPDEGVYCITVEDNHTMLCGRDGALSWTGQSFYGYGGWNRSPLYNPHDAAAVTLTGQAVIKATAEYVNEETPGKVVYGDTDSVYCSWPDNWDQVRTLEYVHEVCDYLNDELYPTLCGDYGIEPQNNRWKMELEKLMKLFMSGSKKRYAGCVRWTEGMDFNKVIVQ